MAEGLFGRSAVLLAAIALVSTVASSIAATDCASSEGAGQEECLPEPDSAIVLQLKSQAKRDCPNGVVYCNDGTTQEFGTCLSWHLSCEECDEGGAENAKKKCPGGTHDPGSLTTGCGETFVECPDGSRQYYPLHGFNCQPSGNDKNIASSKCPTSSACKDQAVPLLALAEMSNMVYDLSASDRATKAAGFHNAENKDSTGDIFKYMPTLGVWTREKPCKQAVIAIRGTNDGNDLVADLVHIVLGNELLKAAKDRVRNVMQKYRSGGYTLLVTGHSLGGWVGEIVSTTYDIPGTVFNAPGTIMDHVPVPVPPFVLNWNVAGPHRSPHFHNVNGEFEWGTWGQHPQQSIKIAGLTDHSIDDMIKELGSLEVKQGTLTNVNVFNHCKQDRGRVANKHSDCWLEK